MTPSSVDIQIRTLYEQQSVPVEEIAGLLEIEPLAVKDSLLRHSQSYRDAQARAEKEGTTSENLDLLSPGEFDTIKSAYKEMALNPETNAFTRERMLRYLIDDKKGRLDKDKLPPGHTSLDITALNQLLQAANALAGRRVQAILNSKDPMLLELPKVG